MADVDLEALSVDILVVSKWTCVWVISTGPGERPRRGPSSWSAITAADWEVIVVASSPWFVGVS